MIDLHTHSTSSDGTLSPSALVSYAAQKGITVLALTDHDTVAGLSEAEAAAKDAGISLVHGIEVTIEWKPGEFHLLGLGIQNTEPLLPIIANLQNQRKTRNDEIVEKMQKDGFSIDFDSLFAFADTKSVGRPHFADFLVSRGVVKSRQAAFDKYFAVGRPYYLPHPGCNLEDAVSAIIASGALPVLAHPLSLYVSWGRFEGVLADFQSRGLCGIETLHPSARAVDTRRLETLASKFNLFVTAGSDFHGELARNNSRIGYAATGKNPIPDRYWTEQLAPRLYGS